MKRVAVSMRVTQAEGYDEPRDTVSRDWSGFLHGLGLLPLFLPNHQTAALDAFGELKPDLLILSGGEDIGTDAARDETETGLMKAAEDTGLPLLGVCRGMQFINRMYGGADTHVEGHVATPHAVTVEGPMSTLYGATVTVNSFHGTGISDTQLADNLTAWAHDGDGYVEGFTGASGRVVGVMWHPERAGAPAADQALLSALIDNGRAP